MSASASQWKHFGEGESGEGSDFLIPPLPAVEQDLGVYFSIARKLQASLELEKKQSRERSLALSSLQKKYTDLMLEADERLKEARSREHEAKIQISLLEERVKVAETKSSTLEPQVEALEKELLKIRSDRQKSALKVKAFESHTEQLSIEHESSAQLNRDLMTRLKDALQKYELCRRRLVAFETTWNKVVQFKENYKKLQLALATAERDRERRALELKKERERAVSAEDRLKELEKHLLQSQERCHREKRDKDLALSTLELAEDRLEELETRASKAFSDANQIRLEF